MNSNRPPYFQIESKKKLSRKNKDSYFADSKSSKIRFNSFNNRDLLRQRFSRDKSKRNDDKMSVEKKNLKKITISQKRVNDSLKASIKSDFAKFERPKINNMRQSINDSRRIDSITIATKISVSKKLSPKLRFLREGGIEASSSKKVKPLMPGSFFKNLKSNSNLKMITPKSSLKDLHGGKSPRRRYVNLNEMNLIRWEGDDWPDIEAELSFGKCLGQGSFAKVFQGIDKKLKKHVAIKVVDKAKLDDDKRKKLAQQEIRILSGIDHKNLCSYYRMLEDHKRVRIFSQIFFQIFLKKNSI